MGYERFNVDGKSVSAWQVAKLLAFEQAAPNKKVGFWTTLKQLGNAINLINGKDVLGVMTRAELEQRKAAFVPKDNFDSSKYEFSQSKYIDWKSNEEKNRKILEDDFNREHYDGEEYENPLFNVISSDQFSENDSEEDEELVNVFALGKQPGTVGSEEKNIRLSMDDRLACKANLAICQKQLGQLHQQVEQLKTDFPGKNWDEIEQKITSKLQDCQTNLDKTKQWSYGDFNSIDTLAKCHIEIAAEIDKQLGAMKAGSE
ncbi:MAG: hypothetical protein LW808_000575 [Verrucomicrobiota bacterium]|nr:MAG: hypothetical protein LW808_000575 [Verrucomicrobiota bacterium]